MVSKNVGSLLETVVDKRRDYDVQTTHRNGELYPGI